MTVIQLSLFPARGFGIFVWGELLVDFRTGQPYFVRSRRVAQRGVDAGIFPWMRPDARVVSVERHDVDPASGLPTYVVL